MKTSFTLFFSILVALYGTFPLSAQTWVVKEGADFPGEHRYDAASFVIDNIAYVGTGYYSRTSTNYSDFYKYDPIEERWTQIADFPGEPRSAAVSFILNGKGYVGLGVNGSKLYNDFYEYNPVTDTWLKIADFPGEPRYAAVSFVIDNIAYVGGGRDRKL
ncbi:MAG: hypothetical protein LUG18_15255 [Candidatus Azobacteroides sp.]|nr:hypothetical protein [Candidatus Azobacteroides sp.]